MFATVGMQTNATVTQTFGGLTGQRRSFVKGGRFGNLQSGIKSGRQFGDMTCRASNGSVGNIVPNPMNGNTSATTETTITTVHSQDEFQKMLDENAEKLVVLMCKAKGCRPCKASVPKFLKASKKFPDAKFVDIVGNESQDTVRMMMSMGVRATPAFYIFKEGQEVHSHTGIGYEKLVNAIESKLAPQIDSDFQATEQSENLQTA